jgi:phosphopantetheinyl transferase
MQDDGLNTYGVLPVQSANGPVAIHYASAALSGERDRIKNTLAGWLVQQTGLASQAASDEPLLRYDGLGCPRFNQGIPLPLAISFSQTGPEIWAAVARTDALGLDVESPENFRGSYPYDRVFSEAEFQCVTGYCPAKEDAAAMLWSCKEAAMKKRGTGFHFTDPRDVRVQSCEMTNEPLIFTVSVATPERISVTVVKERHLWLAFAISG